MGQIIRGLVCATALLFVAGNATAQPQGNDEQKCINKINNGVTKVHAAQGKLNSGCIKDFVNEKVPSADACYLADAKGNVGKKKAKLVDDDAKNCGTVPAFAFTSGTFAGTTAAQAELDLIHDIYGNPTNPNLYLCDTNPAECLCQRQVNGRISKTFRAMSKIFVQCKKAALAIGKDPFVTGAASASDIAQCITNGSIGLSVEADTKGKVDSAESQLKDTAEQFCFTTPNNEFGGGACAGFDNNPAGLAACIRDRVECRFCNMFKAADALGGAINCQTWSGAAGCPN
ncbi:MAG: hypothetical protein SF182_14700 [Deltaproteobacteria bacterium]|nr:hypothetical protein [Deltaproteobacteria bacterium]